MRTFGTVPQEIDRLRLVASGPSCEETAIVPRPIRRRTTAVALAAGALALSGCGAGFDATTSNVYSPANGTQQSRGEITMLNAILVVPEEGPTVLSTTVSNRSGQPDELVSVSVNGTAAQIDGDAAVPAEGVLRIGAGYGENRPDPAVTNAIVTLSGVDLAPGTVPTLTVVLREAGALSFGVPVEVASGYWASAVPESSSAG